jgi:hypothetical protein
MPAEIVDPLLSLYPTLICFHLRIPIHGRSKPTPIGAEGQTCEAPAGVRFDCVPHPKGRREFAVGLVAFE